MRGNPVIAKSSTAVALPAWLGDTKLFIPMGEATHHALKSMISGERLNNLAIRTHWDEILRMATSIKQGTVAASLTLRKLGSYPRQNSLAVALRELGRIERTLFILDWLQSAELRRRVHAGLNTQCFGQGRVLQRAGRNSRLGVRAATLPRQWPEPGDGGHRAVEHGLSGTGCERPARASSGRCAHSLGLSVL